MVWIPDRSSATVQAAQYDLSHRLISPSPWMSALDGLKSDIVPCPKRAISGSQRNVRFKPPFSITKMLVS
jgi:hypothetical protein